MAVAVLRSIALESGFRDIWIRHWCESVRVASPDSGTESHSVAFKGFTEAFLKGQAYEIGAVIPDGFLFPNAFWLPEGSRVWGLIFRTAFNGMGRWEAFLAI
ncbi:unnamed protein product [Prorocentrum cordatum]|uniref:Amine oxidase n=1 Tax=Prorocentrum cordatum TaxID=2364126 RepID=A0ABN9R178_9DINO|nr:unnamed protein product [Polarella glacialis]